MYCHTTLFEVNPTARIDIFVECHGLSVDFLKLILVVDGLLVGSLEVEPEYLGRQLNNSGILTSYLDVKANKYCLFVA
jgi:hypothetical protein